ncbi:sigma-70 family RNA polymerase sigma factor [Zooshikella harenae]|nr:sigma-70 family RNA polymerase sigma factor [Zooshikella harenae]
MFIVHRVFIGMSKKDMQFKALVDAYYKSLYRYAFWLTSDESIAEDLVQETFMRAWRSLDSLQNEQAAKSWLITILRRENARRFQRKSLEYADLSVDELEDQTHSFDVSTDVDAIRQALYKLSDKYREPLVLQVVMGFSQEEIASEMGLPINTVATRLRRARLQLKELLGDDHIKQGVNRRGL